MLKAATSEAEAEVLSDVDAIDSDTDKEPLKDSEADFSEADNELLAEVETIDSDTDSDPLKGFRSGFL